MKSNILCLVTSGYKCIINIPSVTCHVSYVTCPISSEQKNIVFTDKVMEIVRGKSVINGATPSSYIKGTLIHTKFKRCC